MILYNVARRCLKSVIKSTEFQYVSSQSCRCLPEWRNGFYRPVDASAVGGSESIWD